MGQGAGGVAASPKGVPTSKGSQGCPGDPFPPVCLLLGLRPSIPVGLKPPWAHSNMGFSWSSSESPGLLGKVLPARTLAFWRDKGESVMNSRGGCSPGGTQGFPQQGPAFPLHTGPFITRQLSWAWYVTGRGLCRGQAGGHPGTK